MIDVEIDTWWCACHADWYMPEIQVGMVPSCWSVCPWNTDWYGPFMLIGVSLKYRLVWSLDADQCAPEIQASIVSSFWSVCSWHTGWYGPLMLISVPLKTGWYGPFMLIGVSLKYRLVWSLDVDQCAPEIQVGMVPWCWSVCPWNKASIVSSCCTEYWVF